MSIKSCFLLSFLFFITACATQRPPGQIDTQGKPESAQHIGIRYLLGRGVEQSNEQAFSWFQKGAEEGDAFAQSELAYMYATGKGTAQDFAAAVKWYQAAAAQGLASAQYNLGLFYVKGLGVPANRGLAIQWFQKSAAHGFAPARKALQRYGT